MKEKEGHFIVDLGMRIVAEARRSIVILIWRLMEEITKFGYNSATHSLTKSPKSPAYVGN